MIGIEFIPAFVQPAYEVKPSANFENLLQFDEFVIILQTNGNSYEFRWIVPESIVFFDAVLQKMVDKEWSQQKYQLRDSAVSIDVLMDAETVSFTTLDMKSGQNKTISMTHKEFIDFSSRMIHEYSRVVSDRISNADKVMALSMKVGQMRDNLLLLKKNIE